LTSYGVAELPAYPGKKVGVVEFARALSQDDGKRGGYGLVRVYALPAGQFEIRGLTLDTFAEGYTYQLQVRYDQASSGAPPSFAYLVFFTGHSYDWLDRPAGS